jgi:probable F420-dependent oxidoreductase
MEFWVNANIFGPGIDGAVLTDVAEAADALGYDALTVPDHIILPADSEPEGLRTIIESIVALTYMAARTERIRLGTSVLAAPLRHPIEIAKQFASLDVLSGGRVFAGLALGGFESEFVFLGAEWRTRGARLDELIDLMRHLYSGSTEKFDGRFTSIADYSFLPLPVQGEHLPILIGGLSEAAMRRAATRGDMWQASMVGPEEFRPLGERVKHLAGDRKVTVGAETRFGTNWGTRLTGENGDELRAEVAAWRDAGCEHL